MAVKAKLKYLRIAPRKVMLVADLIRGKKVSDAENILNFTVKRGALPIKKLLKQAVSNAENNFKMDKGELFISKIIVNEGPKLKRIMPRAMGRAFGIQKKTSHIEIELDKIQENGKKRNIVDNNKKDNNK